MKIGFYVCVLTKAECGSIRLIRVQKLYRSRWFLSRHNHDSYRLPGEIEHWPIETIESDSIHVVIGGLFFQSLSSVFNFLADAF